MPNKLPHHPLCRKPALHVSGLVHAYKHMCVCILLYSNNALQIVVIDWFLARARIGARAGVGQRNIGIE